MFALLHNRTYAALFGAQIVALIGSGLLTVALGLLAYDLAGNAAGSVLGTAYTIKMIAYVGLSPVAGALVERLNRKTVLIMADLVRGAIALCLPFVDQIWQVYVLIFLLQTASATFTPAYQATLPDVLPDERDYTRALSLSRLTYDLENLLSPALAGVLLLFISFQGLFVGTGAGFLGSALLILSVRLPLVGGGASEKAPERPFADRLTHGIRLYLATPRLRGLFALTLSAASLGAFVLVNTVVVVRGTYGGDASDLALALAAYGAGSMAAALAIPPMLERVSDRQIMMQAAGGLVVLGAILSLLVTMGGWPGWTVFLLLWVMLGAFYSAILTPSGRLLKRSGKGAERPALFTAQFALSHACWLLTYPLAGWIGGLVGMGPALWVLTVLAFTALLLARRVWPPAPGHTAPNPEISPR